MSSMSGPTKRAALPSVEELDSLAPLDVRTALLAQGIGLSESEVDEALRALKARAAQKAPASRGRLVLTADDAPLHAGAPADAAGSSPALEYVVDWFQRTLFVTR